MRLLAASVGGGGARMFTRGVSSAHGARAGRSGMFKAAGVLGGAALFVGALAANPAHSRGVAEEEEDSLSTRALKMVGLHSWFVWAVEPAEKAGCPPGTLLADPPELPPGMIQRTLVLSLEDTLIHTQWDRQRGHRTQKRPGLDAFLAHMSQVGTCPSLFVAVTTNAWVRVGDCGAQDEGECQREALGSVVGCFEVRRRPSSPCH